MPKQADSAQTTASLQRRSQRLLLRVPIELRRASAGKSVIERTSTLAVNAHGALILLTPPVEDGEMLALKNASAREEHQCHVVYVGPTESGKTQVGIEFLTPAPHAWGIVFPPENWTDPDKSLGKP
jgi:hypothetical protein